MQSEGLLLLLQTINLFSIFLCPLCPRRLTSTDCITQTSVPLASGLGLANRSHLESDGRTGDLNKVKVLIPPGSLPAAYHSSTMTVPMGPLFSGSSSHLPASCFLFCLIRPKGANSFLMLLYCGTPTSLSDSLNSTHTFK